MPFMTNMEYFQIFKYRLPMLTALCRFVSFGWIKNSVNKVVQRMTSFTKVPLIFVGKYLYRARKFSLGKLTFWKVSHKMTLSGSRLSLPPSVSLPSLFSLFLFFLDFYQIVALLRFCSIVWQTWLCAHTTSTKTNFDKKVLSSELDVFDDTAKSNLEKWSETNHTKSEIFRKGRFKITREKNYIEYISNRNSRHICENGHEFEINSGTYSKPTTLEISSDSFKWTTFFIILMKEFLILYYFQLFF